ncbi:MAG: hypothetical protein AAF787_14450 [Chloroflexota bacterium]
MSFEDGYFLTDSWYAQNDWHTFNESLRRAVETNYSGHKGEFVETIIDFYSVNPMIDEVARTYIPFLLYIFSLIHQKHDIELVEHRRPVRRKTKRETGKTPSPYFRICDIHPNRTEKRYTEASTKTGRKMPVHAVRGHFRHYENGHIVWVRPHLRGSKDAGISEKSYRIRLD